jgi:hypothetical protein
MDFVAFVIYPDSRERIGHFAWSRGWLKVRCIRCTVLVGAAELEIRRMPPCAANLLLDTIREALMRPKACLALPVGNNGKC